MIFAILWKGVGFMAVPERTLALLNNFKVAEVSEASGLPRPTIYDIKLGRTENPGIGTVEKLNRGLAKLASSRKNADKKQKENRKSANPEGSEL